MGLFLVHDQSNAPHQSYGNPMEILVKSDGNPGETDVPSVASVDDVPLGSTETMNCLESGLFEGPAVTCATCKG